MTSSAPTAIATPAGPQPSFSADGRWFWDGKGWIPARPEPGDLGRPGNCSWNGTALDLKLPLRTGRFALLWAATILVVSLDAAGWYAGVWVDRSALVFAVFWAPFALLYAFNAVRTTFSRRTVHLDHTGVLIRLRLGRGRFIPWQLVRQVGTFYQLSRLLCVDVDPAYWTGRRRLPYRPKGLAGRAMSFPGSEHMIRLPAGLLPITEADFLRCARALAPSTVAVHWGLDPGPPQRPAT